MVTFYEEIPENLLEWIDKQELFWVATAPLSPTGHVNVSPKGVRGSFHIVNRNKVWYQDLSGSGSETIAHIRENGRITVMFSAFEGPPRIVRLWGTGSYHEFGTPEYEALIPVEERRPGSRAAIVVDIHKVGSSCGYAVPYYEYVGQRNTLLSFFENRERADRKFEEERASLGDDAPHHSDKGLKAYWELKNLHSIDGLPAVELGPKSEAVPFSGLGVDASALPGGKTVPNRDRRDANTKSPPRRYDDLVAAFAMGAMVATLYLKVVGVQAR